MAEGRLQNRPAAVIQPSGGDQLGELGRFARHEGTDVLGQITQSLVRTLRLKWSGGHKRCHHRQ
jgi:hypothetical protein